MSTKTIHFCKKRGLAFLLAIALCFSLLPGMTTIAEAAGPSKTISATLKFFNHTGKRITELYFEDSKVEDYGEEYLETRNFKYWSNKKYIMVPLKFKKNVKLDILVCYSDGSMYEARGLKLAKAKSKGSVVDFTASQVSLKVKNKTVASAKFVKIEDEEQAPDVTGVKLNKTAATLTEGQTTYLSATVSPAGANGKVTWSSSNRSVATVSSTGKVTGVKAGTATITAKTADGGYTATCKVTVTAKKVTGVTLNKSTLSLKAGGSAYLTAKVSPTGASGKVTWSSSDASVATVSSTGKVTGVKAGTATITVKTVDGGYTASCKVTVTAVSTTISATINFYNYMYKQIDELYFEESGNSSWGEEYLGTQSIRFWSAGKYLRVPLKFTPDASLDFYIRCNDGSEYEARGLSLAKAKTSGNRIEFRTSGVTLVVNGATTSNVAFTQKKAPTTTDTKISDADWDALQSAYTALLQAYNDAANLYNSDQIKANKDIEALMKEAESLLKQMGTIERAGLTTEDGLKLAGAMKDTAEALVKIVEAMEVVPTTRKINVKFINATNVDFTNFTAKPVGGTGSKPVTLKADLGETTLQFTVADNVSAFEITFVKSANSQPYTMTVTFDSSVKDGDTLTVQFNVDEAKQEIVYSQI